MFYLPRHSQLSCCDHMGHQTIKGVGRVDLSAVSEGRKANGQPQSKIDKDDYYSLCAAVDFMQKNIRRK